MGIFSVKTIKEVITDKNNIQDQDQDQDDVQCIEGYVALNYNTTYVLNTVYEHVSIEVYRDLNACIRENTAKRYFKVKVLVNKKASCFSCSYKCSDNTIELTEEIAYEVFIKKIPFEKIVFVNTDAEYKKYIASGKSRDDYVLYLFKFKMQMTFTEQFVDMLIAKIKYYSITENKLLYYFNFVTGLKAETFTNKQIINLLLNEINVRENRMGGDEIWRGYRGLY